MSPVTMNRVRARLQRDFARVLDGLQMNAEVVKLHVDAAVNPAGFDRNDRATYPAPVPAVREFKALVHFIADLTRGYGAAEFEVGDVLLFFRPTENLSGADAWFEIHGGSYVQKNCGTLLANDLVLQVGGTVIHKGLLLTRKLGQPAALPPLTFGQVDHVLGAVRTPLYAYGAAGFTELPAFDAGMGEIVAASGSLSFFIEGQLAMRAVPTQLQVAELIALGGSGHASALGKIEFSIGGTRVATLTKGGILVVPEVMERLDSSGGPTDFHLLVDEAWVASLRVGLAEALAFAEVL